MFKLEWCTYFMNQIVNLKNKTSLATQKTTKIIKNYASVNLKFIAILFSFKHFKNQKTIYIVAWVLAPSDIG